MLAQLGDEAEDYVASERSYSRAIELELNEAEYYNMRSQMYDMQGNLKAAISDMEQVIHRSSESARLYGIRAKLHRAMGDDAAAQSDDAKMYELKEKSNE